jgi:hypothetical protein
MASTRTLIQMRTSAREHADQVNSGFVSDTELTSYINYGCKKLYDMLIEAFGENYYVTDPLDFQTVANQQDYALPADFYQLVGLDLKISTNEYLTLKPFDWVKRNFYNSSRIFALNGDENYKYLLVGNNIRFVPIPTAVKTMTLHYIPAFTNLSADIDTFDGINGWEEFVIIDAAIKMKQKEESDAQVLMMMKAEIEERITKLKNKRDQAFSKKVSDVRRVNNYYYDDL